MRAEAVSLFRYAEFTGSSLGQSAIRDFLYGDEDRRWFMTLSGLESPYTEVSKIAIAHVLSGDLIFKNMEGQRELITLYGLDATHDGAVVAERHILDPQSHELKSLFGRVINNDKDNHPRKLKEGDEFTFTWSDEKGLPQSKKIGISMGTLGKCTRRIRRG